MGGMGGCGKGCGMMRMRQMMMQRMNQMMQMMDSWEGDFSGEGGGDDVEAFIQSNPIDERAANALREESPAVQQKVLSRGSLQGTQNPSSALMCRIRDARK